MVVTLFIYPPFIRLTSSGAEARLRLLVSHQEAAGYSPALGEESREESWW